ncbi:MAG: hypothetical protein J6A67_05925, partial [Clostridia bacterium]|nr:hypothetical protein [Clostridia bacterium]
QCLPCLKGGGFCEAKDGGILREKLDFSEFFVKISPSHDFVVPAPFRQGGLISATLKIPTNPNL